MLNIPAVITANNDSITTYVRMSGPSFFQDYCTYSTLLAHPPAGWSSTLGNFKADATDGRMANFKLSWPLSLDIAQYPRTLK